MQRLREESAAELAEATSELREQHAAVLESSAAECGRLHMQLESAEAREVRLQSSLADAEAEVEMAQYRAGASGTL